MKNKKIIIGIVAIVAVIAIMCGIYAINRPSATSGSKSVTIEVTDDTATTTSYAVSTDAEYLSQVFDEVEDLTVEGTEGDYGLYINTVNGLTADYDADGAYWAIYVNGEYGNFGADSQPVTDGDTYSLVYETYAK